MLFLLLGRSRGVLSLDYFAAGSLPLKMIAIGKKLHLKDLEVVSPNVLTPVESETEKPERDRTD